MNEQIGTVAEIKPSFNRWANGPRGRAQPVGLGLKRRTPDTTNAVSISTAILTSRKRRGATVTEATIAIAIAAAVLAGVAQLVALASNQRRISERRATAVREVGNLMENLMSRPWAEITPEKLAAVELSNECSENLPDARLQVEVSSEGEGDEAKRIDIQIDWRNTANQRGEPVRLVAWRFSDEEAER